MSIGDKKFSARIRNGFFCQVAMTCDMFMENAKELFEQQPITKVELLDKFPEKLFLKDSPEETSVLFTWFLESPREFGEQQRFQEMLESIERDRARNYLPKSLWGFPAWQPHTSSKQLPEPIWERTKRARESIQESLEVLSQACVDFGRTLAGLPPLKWPEEKLR
ncbi:hypothetical protein KIH39_20530 [Telmatocola sphagniphila]|uniref:Uncharacterized protein n=1 Tax=Telmatocola sphagniphila TaxID=1123043 RepID=A0A8E6EXF8_9BACT|nr:hypothetical protein [Telmatocola sphagniphila]QVL31211.1 hypothetical protein KIH39_20530 [Telmatocola sphagniphila]